MPDYSKKPPQDEIAEQAVIGCILVGSGHDDVHETIFEKLTPESFHDKSRKEIFSVAQELYNAHDTIDLHTVTDVLRQKKMLERVGGVMKLTDLIDSVGTLANVPRLTRILKEYEVRRKVAEIANKAYKSAYGNEKIEVLLGDIEEGMSTISEGLHTEIFRPIAELVQDTKAQFERIRASENDDEGVSTGFPDLPFRLKNGRMYVIAGRPMHGKSVLAQNIIRNYWDKTGKPGAFISLEQPDEELSERLLLNYAQVAKNHIKNDDDWKKVLKAIDEVSRTGIILHGIAGMNINQMRAKFKRLQRVNDVGLFVIDYIGLMEGQLGKKYNSDQSKVGDISRHIKSLALELNVPIVAVSQLNRKCEERPDCRPRLSDLRDSGSVEQDSDVVMLLYRPETYPEMTEFIVGKHGIGYTELMTVKHRGGVTGMAVLRFRGEYYRFETPAKEAEPEIEIQDDIPF